MDSPLMGLASTANESQETKTRSWMIQDHRKKTDRGKYPIIVAVMDLFNIDNSKDRERGEGEKFP